MIDRFEIVGSTSARPKAERIIFCDGTGGSLYQPESDLELSHWRPNKTPAEYRAGTSTEICFRFLENPRPGSWTVAVNNHVDVDGILSVYVLVHGQHALACRQTIIEAAGMGDFWGWGETPAQRVFQGITRLMNSGDGMTVYAEAFRRIPALIDGTDPEIPQIDRSLAPLGRGVELVEQGQITRSLIGDRLAHYIVPLAVAGDDNERASYSPEFNEAISEKAVFWPQVRARWDAERACLVSVERKSGWFHDLWFPGYLWADTEVLWRVPGLTYHDGMGSYDLDNPRMVAAFEALQRQETAPGRWGLGGTQLPFGSELQNRFPLVGRFLDEQGHPAISRLLPEHVAKNIRGSVRLMDWMTWYNGLAKPSWTPAPATIGLIWQILYPIILVSFGFVFVQAFRGKVPWMVALPFAINLVANLIFTLIQFGMRNLPLAAVDILIVWTTIIWMMIAVWRHYRWVAVAQVPYFVWVSLATVLQLSITAMNWGRP